MRLDESAYNISLFHFARKNSKYSLNLPKVGSKFVQSSQLNDSDCRVEDMQPETVTGKEPVKLITSYEGGRAFEQGKPKLAPSAEIAKSEEKNVYYPEIIANWNSE